MQDKGTLQDKVESEEMADWVGFHLMVSACQFGFPQST